MAAYFAAQNRNKASLTVNYTLPEGQDGAGVWMPISYLDTSTARTGWDEGFKSRGHLAAPSQEQRCSRGELQDRDTGQIQSRLPGDGCYSDVWIG